MAAGGREEEEEEEEENTTCLGILRRLILEDSTFRDAELGADAGHEPVLFLDDQSGVTGGQGRWIGRGTKDGGDQLA